MDPYQAHLGSGEATPLPPTSVERLISSLQRVAERHPDPEVREAAARDAEGYRSAWAVKRRVANR